MVKIRFFVFSVFIVVYFFVINRFIVVCGGVSW